MLTQLQRARWAKELDELGELALLDGEIVPVEEKG